MAIKMIDSCDNIHTLVNVLAREERPTRLPVSERPAVEIYITLTPMPSLQFSQNSVWKERTKQITVLWWSDIADNMIFSISALYAQRDELTCSISLVLPMLVLPTFALQGHTESRRNLGWPLR